LKVILNSRLLLLLNLLLLWRLLGLVGAPFALQAILFWLLLLAFLFTHLGARLDLTTGQSDQDGPDFPLERVQELGKLTCLVDLLHAQDDVLDVSFV